ncbi:MAG: hypothetical protein AAF280_13690 [Pseudomonadota bacterium]
MQSSSNFFLAIAGLLGLPMAVLALSLTTGNDAAWMIFGVFFFTIGIPVFGVFLTCLFIGVALRFKIEDARRIRVEEENPNRQAAPFPLRKVFDRIVLAVGLYLLCQSLIYLYKFGYVSNFMTYGIGTETDFPVLVAIAYLIVPFANPILPLGLVATVYGLVMLRKPRVN